LLSHPLGFLLLPNNSLLLWHLLPPTGRWYSVLCGARLCRRLSLVGWCF
jgi:hypothetical protein